MARSFEGPPEPLKVPNRLENNNSKEAEPKTDEQSESIDVEPETIEITPSEGRKEEVASVPEKSEVSFKEGDIVKAELVSGEKDEGWSIISYVDGHFILGKDGITKTATPEELEGWNRKSLLEEEIEQKKPDLISDEEVAPRGADKEAIKPENIGRDQETEELAKARVLLEEAEKKYEKARERVSEAALVAMTSEGS